MCATYGSRLSDLPSPEAASGERDALNGTYGADESPLSETLAASTWHASSTGQAAETSSTAQAPMDESAGDCGAESSHGGGDPCDVRSVDRDPSVCCSGIRASVCGGAWSRLSMLCCSARIS